MFGPVLVGMRPCGLRPQKQNLPLLWTEFLGLVHGTLVELAKVGVVHFDRRLGWDEASNILYHTEQKSMLLIDLESLVCIHQTKSLKADKRYLTSVFWSLELYRMLMLSHFYSGKYTLLIMYGWTKFVQTMSMSVKSLRPGVDGITDALCKAFRSFDISSGYL